jgi:hypothetical protein
MGTGSLWFCPSFRCFLSGEEEGFWRAERGERWKGRRFPSSIVHPPLSDVLSDVRSWRAWRRPTLPCLETEYHWRLRLLTAEFGMGSGLERLAESHQAGEERVSDDGGQRSEDG